MRRAVIAHGDTPPVFELCDHVLDPVAQLAHCFAVGCRRATPGTRRDTRCDAAHDYGLTKIITVVAFVGDERQRAG